MALGLLQALWGDYTYSAKTKRITRLRPHKGDRGRPLFVTLALEPLWKAYAAAQPGADHKVCPPLTSFFVFRSGQQPVVHWDPRACSLCR